MRSVTYISTATTPFSEADLVKLLDKSRGKNFRAGLTGMLLYRNGTFIQTLEGEDEALWTTYDAILRDPRHKGIIKLMDHPTEEREFKSWSRGFATVGAGDLERIPGDTAFLKADAGQIDKFFTAEPSRAHRLLMNFRKQQ